MEVFKLYVDDILVQLVSDGAALYHHVSDSSKSYFVRFGWSRTSSSSFLVLHCVVGSLQLYSCTI